MPAVFVHGVPDTGSEWDAVRSHCKRADIVAPNLPGFGAPIPPGFTATKDEYVDWLIDEIVAMGVPVDIVGHDWGSIIVQRVVSLRPELIRTWAAGAGAIDRAYVWHDLAQMWQTPDVGEQVVAAMQGDTMVDGLADQVGRERAVEMVSHIDDTMRDCILKLYRSAKDGFGAWHDAVDTIKRPGIVFWGADDPYVTAEFGERLAQRTHARLEMYPDSGHWWPITKAPQVAAALQELWGSV